MILSWRVRRGACVAGLGMLLTATATAVDVPKAEAVQNFTIKSDIEYTQGVKGPLKADAYIPNGKGPFPGIVYIHGGGWSGGNRYQMVKLIKELANKGYAGFTIEYDVDPVTYPASYNESIAAIRYLREHASEFHVDPSRIAVAGSSAGGELAALVGLQGHQADATSNSGVSTKVQAAVILNGVLNLTALGDKSNMVTNYLGGVCSAKIDQCKAASPALQVAPGAPPFFVGHGTADEVVPFPQAEDFVSKLREAKVPVRFFTAQGGPHTYWIKEQYFASNLKVIEEFLNLALRAKR